MPIPPSRVAARYRESKKYGVEITEGDIVEIGTSRGPVEAIVVEVTRNWSARTWPYKVRFTTVDGKDYHGKRKSIQYGAPENRRTKYIGRSRKKKLLEQAKGREQGREQRKKDRADELEYLYGIRGRRPSDRSLRWLPATGIVKVVSRAS